MSRATHALEVGAHTDDRAREPATARVVLRGRERVREHAAFATTVVRCLAFVLPLAGRERRHWAARAAAIPNASLRRSACAALEKRGNVEGAALFAVLAQPAYRADAVRALVALQSAYNYLDTLSELPSADPGASSRRLHRALFDAVQLEQAGAGESYYEHVCAGADDGGFLLALIDRARAALSRLPAHAALAPMMSAAALRIADFQALNLSEPHGGQAGLERWANAMGGQQGFAWWETAAGAGSSLALHALVATAARADVAADVAVRIDRAYFPAIGALHSLLDSLVDREEDRAKGLRSLLACYPSDADAGARLTTLAIEARDVCATLPARHVHGAIVTAMCSYYLSAPQCCDERARRVGRRLTDALGAPLRVSVAMFKTKRLLAKLAGGGYA
jgi:tetraprenyl-beta-curcumene synthase